MGSERLDLRIGQHCSRASDADAQAFLEKITQLAGRGDAAMPKSPLITTLATAPMASKKISQVVQRRPIPNGKKHIFVGCGALFLFPSSQSLSAGQSLNPLRHANPQDFSF